MLESLLQTMDIVEDAYREEFSITGLDLKGEFIKPIRLIEDLKNDAKSKVAITDSYVDYYHNALNSIVLLSFLLLRKAHRRAGTGSSGNFMV